MDASLRNAFKEVNFAFKDGEAVKQCKQLADQHQLKAFDIARQYEAFACSKDMDSDMVTVNHMVAFERFLTKELEIKAKQSIKPHIIVRAYDEPQDYRTPKRPATGKGSSLQAPNISPQAMAPMSTPDAGTPLHATPGGTQFAARQNKGQVIASYNDKLPVPARPQGAAGLPSFQVLGEQLAPPNVRYLHMVDTLEGRVHAINERILNFGEAVKRAVPEAADLNQNSVAEVSQEPVWVAGRVVPESDTGALNDQSVLLEGSREASGGARVRLDLSQVPSFRLFPGQVVAAKGLNPTGSVFVAQQLVTHCPPSRPAVAALPTVPAPTQSSQRGLSMVVAAGPFTTTDNMCYEPIQELLSYCSSNQVNQLLLLGPFVDAEHPKVKDGSLDITFDQLYEREVRYRLAAWQQQESNRSCRVLLVPSMRDVHQPPVFPQPPMETRQELGDRQRTLQNPVSFVSEGLVVAASSQDVLMHLSGGEVSRGQQGQDALTARASHVVGQRSFYPLFPAPLGSCLNLGHDSCLQLAGTPDLLILPSNLTPFAKMLPLVAAQQLGPPTSIPAPGAPEAVVVVNPGRLAKGVSGGTFAHVYLAPAADGIHDVQKLLRVDIKRL